MAHVANRSGHSTWRERERQRAREIILTSAAELFAHFGYVGTSVKQIAERAGLSVGKLYTHFKGKEEIYRELLEAYIRELHSKGEKACKPNDPPLRQLRCRIEAAIEHFKENLNLVLIYHNENPLMLKGIIMKEIGNNRRIIAGFLSRAIERGEIPHEDANILAAMLLGAIHGLLYQLAESGSEEALESVPAIVDRIILSPLERRQAAATGTGGY